MHCNDCKIPETMSQLWEYKNTVLCMRCLKQHLHKDGIIKPVNEPEHKIPTPISTKEDKSLL